jgi:hypothetical protein
MGTCELRTSQVGIATRPLSYFMLLGSHTIRNRLKHNTVQENTMAEKYAKKSHPGCFHTNFKEYHTHAVIKKLFFSI